MWIEQFCKVELQKEIVDIPTRNIIFLNNPKEFSALLGVC
jgi:hypothetical protein